MTALHITGATTIAPKRNLNPGIVPPWLAKPDAPNRNGGIVPPWLERAAMAAHPTLIEPGEPPVTDDQVPHIW